MDALLKGLGNVALDAIQGGAAREDDGDAERAPSHEHDRSKSTWAEVVSSGHGERGGADKEDSEGRIHHQRHHQSTGSALQYAAVDDNAFQVAAEVGNGGGDWEAVGDRKHRRHPLLQEGHPLKEHWQGFKKPPSEQTYSADVHHIHQGLNTEPTWEELDSLAAACARLWELDMNRLAPGKDYKIEVGEGKKVYQKRDMASENLFTWVHEDLFRRPTYSRFIALLDNYNPRDGYKEHFTVEEQHEQVAFIEEICRTAPLKYLFQHLVSKGVVSRDFQEFKIMMQHLWFDLYGRGGGHGSSSAFEHVFVGEIRGRRGGGDDEVSGFHNWIQFHIEEAKGNVDYQGYVFPRHRGEIPCSETQLLTIQFTWHGVLKSVSSTLIGVSPEFEIALYTLCFFAGEESNLVHLGPYSADVKCYRLGSDKIGSVFPVAEI